MGGVRPQVGPFLPDRLEIGAIGFINRPQDTVPHKAIFAPVTQVMDKSTPLFDFQSPSLESRGNTPPLSLKQPYMDNACFSAESAPLYKMSPSYL